MTRRSTRELENRLDALDEASDDEPDMIEVVWKDERTGELVDREGNPTEPDPDALMIVFNESVVMTRERAEEEGREILGPAEDTLAENDAVRVAREDP